jgi:spermidine synthase
MGEISLRRRRELTLDLDVYEAKLDDEFLMSSLFPVAEIALADLTLAELPGADLDVVVGGLGLGYTAQAALRCDRVGSLAVIEAVDAVCSWHRRHLLPTSAEIVDDPRTTLVTGDFFAMVRAGRFEEPVPATLDAVLLDVDHTPDWHLHPSHADLYTPEGLARMASLVRPGGVFALWSDARPDPAFIATLRGAFAEARAEVVEFANPLAGGTSANTVYLAFTA